MTERHSSRLWEQLSTIVLAFILAIIVWVVAERQENPVATILVAGVPVKIQNLPEKLVLTEQPVLPEVDIKVRGPRSILDTLTASDFNAYIDLSEAQTGSHQMKISVQPRISGVTVLATYPEAVLMNLDQKVEKEVTVNPNLIGDPPFGYVAASPIITPTKLLVTGPESLVEKVTRAEITVQLTDARKDVKVTDFVRLRDERGSVLSGLKTIPKTVTVYVPIEQRKGFAEKTILPKTKGQPAKDYIMTGITVVPTTITLFGDPVTLAQMPPFVETVQVDISGATEDIEERVPVVLPEAVAAVGSQSVVVHVRIEPVQGSQTMTLSPVVQGLDPDLIVVGISPQTIDVILQGPLSKLKSLVVDVNVRAVLNLSGMNDGVHTVIPVLILPDGVTVQTVLPDTVQVTIGVKPTPGPTVVNETPTPAVTTTPTPSPAPSS